MSSKPLLPTAQKPVQVGDATAVMFCEGPESRQKDYSDISGPGSSGFKAPGTHLARTPAADAGSVEGARRRSLLQHFLQH